MLWKKVPDLGRAAAIFGGVVWVVYKLEKIEQVEKGLEELKEAVSKQP